MDETTPVAPILETPVEEVTEEVAAPAEEVAEVAEVATEEEATV